MAMFQKIKKITKDKTQGIKSITISGITYDLKINHKDVRRLTLKINNEGIIVVSAPRIITSRKIFNFISANEEWVKKMHDIISKRRMHDIKDFGFMHFLGKKYIVNVTASNSNKITLGKVALFKVKDNSKENLLKVYKKFMKEQSQATFYPLINKWSTKMGLNPQEIKFKHLTSKWGSCHATRKLLTFNTQLMMHDEDVIEYVIVHELAHMFVQNHSSKFWSIVKQYLPNYKQVVKNMKLGGIKYE